MVVTNHAKSKLALLIGNSGLSTDITTSVPGYFVLGSGSGTALITSTTLVHAVDRQLFTSITNSTNKVAWQGDWNSVELSGLNIKEFGVLPSGGGLTGSIWSITGFPGITFDGTNELRVEETWEVF